MVEIYHNQVSSPDFHCRICDKCLSWKEGIITGSSPIKKIYLKCKCETLHSTHQRVDKGVYRSLETKVRNQDE